MRRGKPKRDWWQARKWVADRARGLCEAPTPACPAGPHQGVHAHHVLTRAQGGSDDPSNLLWVCAAGHGWIHDHPAKSYELRLLAHAWTGKADIPVRSEELR